MSPEAYATRAALGHYKLAYLSPEVMQLLKRHVAMPAAIGGGLGAAMGLYRGVTDILSDREPDANPLTHPLKEMAVRGVRGAGAGISTNAALELLKFLAQASGMHMQPPVSFGKSAADSPFRTMLAHGAMGGLLGGGLGAGAGAIEKMVRKDQAPEHTIRNRALQGAGLGALGAGLHGLGHQQGHNAAEAFGKEQTADAQQRLMHAAGRFHARDSTGPLDHQLKTHAMWDHLWDVVDPSRRKQ